MHDKRNSRDAKYDRELALGKRMNTSRRVIRDKSVAEVTISTPRVSDHKRAAQAVKCLRSQPEIGLRLFRPLPTKTCVLVYTDSALDNAEADPDEEGSDDEWLAKAKQKVSVSVLSMVHWCVCGGSRRSGENCTHSNHFHDLEEQSFEKNHPVYFWSRSQCTSRRS